MCSTEIALLLFGCVHHQNLHSFPTRRSSDLVDPGIVEQRVIQDAEVVALVRGIDARQSLDAADQVLFRLDRKSTRLNSSHGYISYAVFCLKKKTYDIRAEETSFLSTFN